MVNVLENAVESEAIPPLVEVELVPSLVAVEAIPSLTELEVELHYDFKKAKDMVSSAFHIQGKEGTALCGTSAIFCGTKTVDVEGIMVSLRHQNGGWWWCEKCAAAYTGHAEQFFEKSRIHHG
jgi:hypothetical protein